MGDDVRKLLHDLNGSLAVIKGFLTSLEPSTLTDTQREHHGAAMRSAEKIARAVKEVAEKRLNMQPQPKGVGGER